MECFVEWVAFGTISSHVMRAIQTERSCRGWSVGLRSLRLVREEPVVWQLSVIVALVNLWIQSKIVVKRLSQLQSLAFLLYVPLNLSAFELQHFRVVFDIWWMPWYSMQWQKGYEGGIGKGDEVGGGRYKSWMSEGKHMGMERTIWDCRVREWKWKGLCQRDQSLVFCWKWQWLSKWKWSGLIHLSTDKHNNALDVSLITRKTWLFIDKSPKRNCHWSGSHARRARRINQTPTLDAHKTSEKL